MNELIAVIDDEEDISGLVSLHLKRSGYLPRTFFDAKSFHRFLNKQLPELIILDLMLPDADGIDICKELKKNEKTAAIPVIILTAKGGEADKIIGLELGADDYVTKPFSPRELVARVKVILKRKLSDTGKAGGIYNIGKKLTLDTDKYKVFVEGNSVKLTTTEFKILDFLARQPGKIYSRDRILEYLWGDEKAVLDRTVDVHIRKLREKLGKAAFLIKNIRGVGYTVEE